MGVQLYRAESEEPYDDVEKRVHQRYFVIYLYITLGSGLVLALYYLIRLVTVLFKANGHSLFVPSNTIGESRIKKAATRKMNTVLTNACNLHDDLEPKKPSDSRGWSMGKSTSADETMLNFVLRGNETKRVGGFLWIWDLLKTGGMFEKEGIWLPTRLIIFQTAQVGFTIILTLIFLSITRLAADLADEAQATLPDDLPKWASQ